MASHTTCLMAYIYIYIYTGYFFETDTFSKVWLRNDKGSNGSNLASLCNDIRETQRVSVWATEKLSYWTPFTKTHSPYNNINIATNYELALTSFSKELCDTTAVQSLHTI